MVETRVPVVEFTAPAPAAMVEYIAHALAVVYVCTGDGADNAANESQACLLVMQAVLFFDFGSRTECLRRRFRQKLEKQRRKLETEQAYGRSEEASKVSETENQLVHLQRPSEKRLTIESSSVSQWACLQYARGRVRCQSQWKSRIGTYAEGRVRRTAPAVIAAHRQWWNTPHHRQL